MNERKNIHLWVNGKEYNELVRPDEMLVDFLRDRLNLTGTKVGCKEAECGACTVLVDDVALLSCVFPASRANGKHVLTIEGLAQYIDGELELHPLQEAFVKYGAVQCGFCIPGQIMMAYGLLTSNNNPTQDDIRSTLKDTLCRCGGYGSIERAILATANALNSGEDLIPPIIPESKFIHQVVGRVEMRPEAIDKVTGKALYSDDLKFDDMLHGYTLRAGVPHARLKKLDLTKAWEVPGVKAVLTAQDIPGNHNHGIVIPDWPILVGIGEKIRYVGDAIAIVAAETYDLAVEAAHLIEVEYDLLPVITNPVQSIHEKENQLHPTGNLLKHIKVRKGDIEDGFTQSDLILEHTFHTAMTDHAFIEPECSIARTLSDGKVEVYVGSQIPYADRGQVAAALSLPEDKVRIIGMLIGGGFGGKEDIMGQIHSALLAQKTQRPVKILYDRHESLLVHPKRHATQIRVKIGAKSDGSLMAVETELYGDTGAYASLGEKVMTRATTHSSGPYSSPNVKADCFAMYTNNPPAGAFRGFGVTQSAFAVESMMDMLASQLKIDPIKLRFQNALKIGDTTNTGQVLLESVGLSECIEKVSNHLHELAGEDPFLWKAVNGYPERRRAWGFAVAYKNTGLGGGAKDNAKADVELFEDGTLEVRTSSAELGQGLVTVLRMIVAEEFGVPSHLVRVLLSDTDLTPDGGPTTASRQTYVTGNAARWAAKSLREELIREIAERHDISPDKIQFHNGNVIYNGMVAPLSVIASERKRTGRKTKITYDYIAPTTHPLGTGGDMHFAYSFAAQAAEVEVNTYTGEVDVLRIITATDVGAAINPLGLQGQVEGGIVMGIGNALLENFIVENGMVVTDRLARYRIPSIMHNPEIISFIVENPTSDGPYGAKGVGEIVSIPTTPAITNAIYNAVGVRIDTLPVDQELIVRELRSQKE